MATFGKSLGGGRRANNRSPVAEQVVAATTVASASAVVLDISPTGARLRGIAGAAAGHDVHFRIGKCRVFGTVQWVRGDMCGVNFDEPLHAFAFRELRQKLSDSYLVRGAVEEKLAFDDWNSSLVR